MEETIVRSAEEIERDWQVANMTRATLRDDKGPDAVTKEIRYLEAQSTLQAVTDMLDLVPINKTDLAKAVAAMSLGNSLAQDPSPQMLAYNELLDELIASGRAGKFTETLINSVPAKDTRDTVAALFIAKLINDMRFARVRTAIVSLGFTDHAARLLSGMRLAMATNEPADVDLLRSLAAPILAGTDVTYKVWAYLSVYSFTRFPGDLQLARAAADAPQPADKAAGHVCLAVAFADVEETAAAWKLIAAIPKCEEQTKLFFGMNAIAVCWALGGLGLPRLPEDAIKRIVASVPVASWRNHLAQTIAQAQQRQK